MLRLGPGALSDAELLAIFINTGIKGENAIQVAQRILGEIGSLRELSRQEPESLVRNKALGPAKAAAAMEATATRLTAIGRRRFMFHVPYLAPTVGELIG